MQESAVVLFVQKLAANTKPIRDKAVRKLKKWLAAREAAAKHLSEEDMMKLWKGLFYCMWMQDKPVVQEELAKTISEIIYCFGTTDSSLRFIRGFFDTMSREWSNLDYLRVDKYMMFVRVFLNQSFEFVHKLKWNNEATNQLVAIIEDSVINPKSEDTPVGLQMHMADIYVEELAKVASNELSGKQLTSFFMPYCRLLAESKNAALRWTVIHHVFEFTMRLCDSDSEGDGEFEDDNETKETSVLEGEKAALDLEEDEDVDVDVEELDNEEDDLSKVYGEYKGEDKFLRRVRQHEMESMKLPFPNFDYKDIGDTLLDMVGKGSVKINQKLKNQTYRLVKRFHEMASGIYPLDGVNPSIGRRLRSTDYDAAAVRLLRLDEEIAEEKRIWEAEMRKARKRKSNAKSKELESAEVVGLAGKGGSMSEDEEPSNEIGEVSSSEDEKGSPKSVVQKSKRLCHKEHSLGTKLREDKSGPLGRWKKDPPIPKAQASKKRRLLEVTRDSPSTTTEKATKKAKIMNLSTISLASSQDIPIDKLAQRLMMKVDMPVAKNYTDMDPKARRAAAKRNRRKARALRVKAAKLVRKAKALERAMDANDPESLVPKKKPTQAHAPRTSDASAEIKAESPAASKPLLPVIAGKAVPSGVLLDSNKILNPPSELTSSADDMEELNATSDLVSSADAMEVLDATATAKMVSSADDMEEFDATAKLVTSADDTEAQKQAAAQMFNKMQKEIKEEQSTGIDLILEDAIIANKRSEDSSSGELKVQATTDSAGASELLVRTLPKTPSSRRTKLSTPLVDENSQSSRRLTRRSKLIDTLDGENSDPGLLQEDETEKGIVEKVAALPKANVTAVVPTPEASARKQRKGRSIPARKSSHIISPKRTAEEKSVEMHSDLPQPSALPSPKRKVEFVTLWTPSEKKSPTSSETLWPRRSARTARIAVLDKQSSSTRGGLAANKDRYYDEVAATNFDQPDDVVVNKSNAPEVDESTTNPKRTPMVQFEDFVKTPPAFFRQVVRKVTPQKILKSSKRSAPAEESKEASPKSTKKVNFSLANNSAQGLRHYAMSLRSRPGIPFNADKVPSQGVLKASPPVNLDATPKKRRSIK